MKRIILPLILLAILLVGTSSHAATIRAEASPLLGPGYIELGVPFTIDLYMNNNDGSEHVGYSMPLAFYSPDNSLINIVHRDVGGEASTGSIVYQNDFDSYWTILNEWFEFGWDGSLPDTINHTVATLTGWPPGLGEQLYIQFNMQANEEGTLCVDSIQHANPTYDWLFDFPTSFSGPYCWEVVTEIPQDPEIGVDPGSFYFEGIAGNPPPPAQVLEIFNTAQGTLEWDATWNSSWLYASPAFGTAPSNVQVGVNISGLGVGTYHDTITVSDPDALNNPVLIPVTLVLNEPPATIELSDDFFSFFGVADSTNPDPQTLVVDNSGGGVLNWTGVNNESWLTVSPSAGTDYTEVDLIVDITGLSFGVYYDTVTITAPNTTNSPQEVEVRLEVASSLPVLATHPTQIDVAVDIDSPLPPDEYFDIFNDGAGSMNYTLQSTSGFIASMNPDSGAVPQTVTVAFDSVQGLAKPDTIWVYSDEAINSPLAVPVVYHLSADPAEIIISKDSVNATIYECSQGVSTWFPPNFTVYNGGTDPFDFTLSFNSDWLMPDIVSGSAPQLIRLYFDEFLAPGTYYDTITVSAYNAINDPQTIPIKLTVLPTPMAPEIYLSSDIPVMAAQEERIGRFYSIEINNYNPGCMEWDLEEEISWVEWFLDDSSEVFADGYPWRVRFTPNAYGLTLGHYIDTGYITSPTDSNAPYLIEFDLYVWKLHGDATWDGLVNMLDIVYMIDYLYKDGPPPFPETIVGDVNCDGRVNLVDLSYIIDYLYHEGSPLCGNPF